MGDAELVVMAAGIGSRFGEGVKQLEPVGPKGEAIMDYSIYDALEAGFRKIVFVIRKDLERDFKERIGKRIEGLAEVSYVYQELENIPNPYRGKFPERTKPWGTGQAVLCCKEEVQGPFLVINADDYYGREAYQKAYQYLTLKERDKKTACMVGFVLKNTLSDNGGVTRGICQVDENRMLTKIVETYNIEKIGKGAGIYTEKGCQKVDINAEVSMNMWGLSPYFFDILDKEFKEFLERTKERDTDAEFLLPDIIGKLLKRGEIRVKVLRSCDKWFGITYKKDKESVIREIRKLTEEGIYKEEYAKE